MKQFITNFLLLNHNLYTWKRSIWNSNQYTLWIYKRLAITTHSESIYTGHQYAMVINTQWSSICNGDKHTMVIKMQWSWIYKCDIYTFKLKHNHITITSPAKRSLDADSICIGCTRLWAHTIRINTGPHCEPVLWALRWASSDRWRVRDKGALGVLGGGPSPRFCGAWRAVDLG